MKIKNIQQYRSFYKNEIRDQPTRDEHFIGNFLIDDTGKRRFGWFEIYHGDKEGYGKAEAGIENFLQSFLDMAKDGQAVYEFLQNAVDAGSTHYTMVWNRDEIDGNYYLLVANNGQMFNLDSVRSILNVGSSTKTANSETIGKFGIGFKLAHRLVGKDNGLQELINEHSGPILFSWKNYEIEHLANREPIEPSEIKYKRLPGAKFEIEDNNPWLFKILITCFPCLPENEFVRELPKMANGIEAQNNPFSGAEYEVLSRWIKNNQGVLNRDTYKEGALFFLKLGAGKESELAEVNLKEGVKFALAILKETTDKDEKRGKVLHTVQLNDEPPITYPELEYIKINIDREKEQDTYAYVRFGVERYEELTIEQQRRTKEEGDIEALFGFRRHDEIGEYFKGAPNLYLYFPLSEEVHNFNYILHSNAFYKGSSRTFLHKGSGKEDGINERLLKTLVDKIDEELGRLSASSIPEERQLFLHFYAALLTSGKSTNKDRLWIEDPYINRIDNLLRKYIPVRTKSNERDFTVIDRPEEVFVKRTHVGVDLLQWNIQNVNWFYWDDEADVVFVSAARTKLNIRVFNILNLLSINDGISGHLNNWIVNDEEKIQTVLGEIALLDAEVLKDTIFKGNMFRARLLKFNNGEILTINEFQEREKTGYFIVFNKLNEITDLLEKLGLYYTIENFDHYHFNPKFFSYFANESQVKNYTNLTKLFSQVVNDERLITLNPSEKYRIFEAFRTLNDTPGERMGELKLFKNNSGRAVCLKNLYSSSTTQWLNRFCIASAEDRSDYKKYLLDKPEEIYEGLVYPFWEQILTYMATDPGKAGGILDDINRFYESSRWQGKDKFQLCNYKQVAYRSEVIVSGSLFLNADLLRLDDDMFKRVQIVALNYFHVHIPDKYLLPYLNKPPYSFTSCTIEPLIPGGRLQEDEVSDLLLFTDICNIDFFSVNSIELDEDGYLVHSAVGRKQVVTAKANVLKYLDAYYPGRYLPLPITWELYKHRVELSDGKLIEHIIDLFTQGNPAQEMDLIEIVLSERLDDKKNLLNKLACANLDASWTKERENELYIKLLRDIVEDGLTGEELGNIHRKISINEGEYSIIIGDVDSAHDAIEVLRGERRVSLSQSRILNLDDADNIKLIHAFHDEAQKRGWLSQVIADKLFKLSNTGITNDLVIRFGEKLNDNQLENAHQLLFVWLSGKFPAETFKNYAVKSYDNEWYFLEGQIVLYSRDNQQYIKPLFMLSEIYNDLQSLLEMSDIEPFNYNSSNDNDIIAPRFLFVKGLTAEILESTGSIDGKLDYLYNGWVNLPALNRVSKRKDNWGDFLGIRANEYILNGIHIEEELLPDSIISWLGDNIKKQSFLRDIGVYVGDSPIEKIRRFLTGHVADIAGIDLERFNGKLLLNTVNGLSGQFNVLNGAPFIYHEVQHSPQLMLIERIIDYLISNSVANYPVLVYAAPASYKMQRAENSRFYSINEVLHAKLKMDNGNCLGRLYSEYNIVRPLFVLGQDVGGKYAELELERIFFSGDIQTEHGEPFYRDWKAERNIQLFRATELRFDIAAEIEGETILIGRISEGDFYMEKDSQGMLKIVYTQHISLEELSRSIAEEDREVSAAIDDLINRRNVMLTSIYNALNSAGKGEMKSSHLEALQLAFKEEDKKQRRKELVDNIKESTEYSYAWFESYLKFLLTFESKQDTTVQKTIVFQKIKRYIINKEISNRYFLLCGASSLIPLNIEDFEDFKITLVIKNRQNENIKVEGVSRKGQDLLIYCRESIPQTVISLFSDVIQIRISFSPVIDLMERLYKAFVNRNNIDEWDDMKATLPALHFIYGPPGTGKTTTLCSEVIDRIKEHYNARYLILTPTNKAADVLCKKLVKQPVDVADVVGEKLKELEKLGRSISITRIGMPTDPELEELEEGIYQDSLNRQQLEYTNVLASTIHRIPYFEVIDEEEHNIKLFKLKDHWDYVIFDEASMINLPYLVFSIMSIRKSNPNAKFIIAGDPKQIPPVVDVDDRDLEELDIQDKNIYTMMSINSFKRSEQALRAIDTIQNLDRQYRSIKHIGQLFSDFSYSNLLKHDREEKGKGARPLPEKFRNVINQNVTFINVPLNNENSIFKISKLLYSSYHTYSAVFVAEIIKHFDSLLENEEVWTVGLIAPYKAQAVLLNKLITSYGISERLRVYSDTVHGFQGDECDIVFYVANPNQYWYTGHPKCLLSKEYIYNVAISRARDYLVILHPFETIQDNPFLNSIRTSYENNFERSIVRRSEDVERVLFNQGDYIERNSYITGHDNVNVFGQVELKYFIKANDNAIDIQLRKL